MRVQPAVRHVVSVTTDRTPTTSLPIYREWKSTPLVVQRTAVYIWFIRTIFKKKCAGNIFLWQEDTRLIKKNLIFIVRRSFVREAKQREVTGDGCHIK